MLSLLLIKYWYFESYGSFAYKYILSMSGWFFIISYNKFDFPDSEPPIINILYGWSGIYGTIFIVLSPVFNIIIKVDYLYVENTYCFNIKW